MSWKFAWASCAYPGAPTPALDRIRAHDVRFLHLQGDTPYMWYSGALHGITSPAITKTSTAADFALHHAQQRAAPHWAEFVAWASANDRPIYYMPDDHEWGGDNWDHTTTQANAASFNLSCASQAEVNAHWWEGMQGARQYMTDNPGNSDAEAVEGDIPSQALVGDTPPASHYPINYFRVGYDLAGNVTSGTPHIEFFALDNMSYRSPIAATDNGSKTMLGATQKAWLKARLVASTAVFRPVLCTKKLTRNLGADNNDTWGYYTTERDEILAHFAANGVTAAPWLVGDRHVPNVAQLKTANGDSADALCVCACPVGVPYNADPAMDLSNSHIWRQTYNTNTVHRNVYGLGIVETDRLTLQLRDGATDGILWSGYIKAGSNVVQYGRSRLL